MAEERMTVETIILCKVVFTAKGNTMSVVHTHQREFKVTALICVYNPG